MAAIFGGIFLGGGFKPLPDHAVASQPSLNLDDGVGSPHRQYMGGQGMLPNTPDVGTQVTAQPTVNSDYKVGSDYHASTGNWGIPYQPKVSKEDIGQMGKDVHGALEKVNGGLDEFYKALDKAMPSLIVLGSLAAILATAPISAPVAVGGMALGIVGVGIAAGSEKAKAKELQKNRGLLEHTPPENVKGLVKPDATPRPSRNINDSLDWKYQQPGTRNGPMASTAMDMEWAKRNQTITQIITNHQIFHMNFNGSILQDPPALTKNVASAMGNKAVASGGYTNIGARGTSV